MKPMIFISAVSRELHSARDLVAKTLSSLGFDADWQDIFGTEQGDIKDMLRRRIDAAEGLIQLVGRCYGFEPAQPDVEFDRVSYTQYEALYARKHDKKVWFILLDETFPADSCDGESDEQRRLQHDYRLRIHEGHDLWHTAINSTELENRILKLPQHIQELRSKHAKRLDRHEATTEKILSMVQTLAAKESGTPAHDEQILRAFARLPVVLGQMQHDPADTTGDARLATAYARLETEHGLTPGALKKKLPEITDWLLGHRDLDPIVRAHALFIQRQYEKAEQTALLAAQQHTTKIIEAYELAGCAAIEQVQYVRALNHFRAGAALTDQQRDFNEWARVQHSIAIVLYYKGDYRSAIESYRTIVDMCQRVLGPEHPDTLDSLNNLAVALNDQGRYAEAEAVHRAILAIRQQILGSEHPRTLGSRNNLAEALRAQGKNVEAEIEFRAVITIEKRILGSEHPDTLGTRNNLALVLHALNRSTEAEKEQRSVVAAMERAFGPEHPTTLSSRNTLAIALSGQKKHAEAEKEFRFVLAAQERLLGPDHPTTLASRNNLGLALNAQSKHSEAETEFRAVLTTRERVLGLEHPDVFQSCYNLALCLRAQRKLSEALAFAKKAFNGLWKTMGPEASHTYKAASLVVQLE